MSSRVKRVENRPLKLHTLAVNRDLTLHLRRPGRLAGSRRARESKNLLAGGGQEKGGEGIEGWRVSSGRERRGLKRVVVCHIEWPYREKAVCLRTGELSLHFLFTFLHSSLWGGDGSHGRISCLTMIGVKYLTVKKYVSE